MSIIENTPDKVTLTQGNRFHSVNVYRNRLGLERVTEVVWDNKLKDSKMSAAAIAMIPVVRTILQDTELQPIDRQCVCFAVAYTHFELREKDGNVNDRLKSNLSSVIGDLVTYNCVAEYLPKFTELVIALFPPEPEA